MVSSLLREESVPMSPDIVSRIKLSAATLYAGSADMSVATLNWFLLNMLYHPTIQAQAQAEIDRVVAPERLPTLADRDNLPYVNAPLREVLRWNPISPMLLPHASTADETIVTKTATGEEEYSIPNGSLLMLNLWWMLRDPARYRDPDACDPARFLVEKPETDPATIMFGFGRRICPGRVMADATVWLFIARMLVVYSIEKKRDEVGGEVEVEGPAEGTTGLVSQPKPFGDAMVMRVREVRRGLLERLAGGEVWEEGDAEKMR